MAVDVDTTWHTVSADDTVDAILAADEEDATRATGHAEGDAVTAVTDELVDGSCETSVREKSLRTAALVGMVMIVLLGGLTAFLGVRAHQSTEESRQRELLLQVGRQGAVNLTTVNWQNVEADVQRILDSATGQFHEDFAQRSQPFIDVVKQAQSSSVGTVTEAGVESASGDGGQVLVSVSVKTTSPNQPEEDPRNWRMRVTVAKVGDEAKVSNVEFVS